MEEKTAKEISREQEVRVAKIFGGYTTARSGAGPWQKCDVGTGRDGLWVVECKTTVKPSDSYSIKKSVLDKMDHERAEMRKPFAALAFTLGEKREDYFVLDRRVMSSLLGIVSDIMELKEKVAKGLSSVENMHKQLTETGGPTSSQQLLYEAHKTELENFMRQLEGIV